MAIQRKDQWLLQEPLAAGVTCADAENKMVLWKEGMSKDGKCRQPHRFITVPWGEEEASDRARATVQQYREATRTMWERLSGNEPADSISGPGGIPVKSTGKPREGLLLRLSSEPVSPGTLDSGDVIALGDHLRFVIRNKIAHLIAPTFQLQPPTDPRRMKPMEEILLPVLQDVTQTLTQILGPLAHDGTPLKITLAESEDAHCGTAAALRKMVVQTGMVLSDMKDIFAQLRVTPYHEVRFFDSSSLESGNLLELAAHELGHALVGAGAPQHDPIQEGIARIVEYLVKQCYRGTLADAPEAFDGTEREFHAPEILAGKPGWGLPEHLTMEHSGWATHAFYAAYTVALLRAAGGVENAKKLFRAIIEDWNRAEPNRSTDQRLYELPSLRDWLRRMDTVIPGFSDRYEKEGMYREQDWVPQGERIAWREIQDGVWEITAMNIVLNPQRFQKKSKDTNELDMLYARTLPLEGTLTVHIDGDERIMRTPPFMGKMIFAKEKMMAEAEQGGIHLKSGTKVTFRIQAGNSVGEKTIVW